MAVQVLELSHVDSSCPPGERPAWPILALGAADEIPDPCPDCLERALNWVFRGLLCRVPVGRRIP
jgi:hypothetical protein